MKSQALVISVKPQWAEAIFTGKKTVELRRRFVPHLAPDSRAIIYASAPISAVIGSVKIDFLLRDTPERLWPQIEYLADVRHSDYAKYFTGSTSAIAIFLRETKILKAPVYLPELRDRYGFNPPVSWRWAKSSEIDLLGNHGE